MAAPPSEGSHPIPERVLKGIFGCVNQVRVTNGVEPLEYNKDLSLLAGEHACNMSTGNSPLSHDTFDCLKMQAPSALSFSENIAKVAPSGDPVVDAVCHWIDRPSARSRILGSFTHTGIGVAESEDGSWFVSQIFASFKDLLSAVDLLLLVLRFANQIRKINGLPGLGPSLETTSLLLETYRAHPASVTELTQAQCWKLTGTPSSTCVVDVIPSGHNPLETLFHQFSTTPETVETLCQPWTDLSFVMLPIDSDSIAGVLVLSERPIPLISEVPMAHTEFVLEWKALEYINGYRVSRKKAPLRLSHSWCRAASKLCGKMAQREVDTDPGRLSKKITANSLDSHAVCELVVLVNSADPIRELVLTYLSSQYTRSVLLSHATEFGLGCSKRRGSSMIFLSAIGNIQTLADEPAGVEERETIFDALCADEELTEPKE